MKGKAPRVVFRMLDSEDREVQCAYRPYPCVKRCSPYCASTRPTASRVTTHSPEARRHRPVSAIRMGIGSLLHATL
jgi:hypothetical protein